MKPLKLKIAGLNSFIEEQVIDFSALTSRGLFGIFGPTGSGKSSILDAITMALYGKISRDTTEFINTEKDQLYVSFEFTIGSDRHYIIERKLKSKEDGGYQTSFCRLICKEDGEEEIIDKYTEINQAMEERVIGLKHEDFIKSVVLPQGKFSEFLQLRGRDRRDMLERILGLEEFGRKLEEKIKTEKNQRKDIQKELITLLTQYEEYTEETLQSGKDDYQKYQEEELLLGKEIEEKSILLEEYNEIWKAQQSLAAQLEYKVKIESDIGDISDKKNILEMGRKALSLKPYYDNLEKIKDEQKQYRQSRIELLSELESFEEREELISRKFGQIQKEREEKTPYLERIRTEVGQVIKLVEENKEKQKELLKAKKDYGLLKQDLDNIKDEISNFNARIEKGKRLLEDKETLEKSLQVSAILRKKVSKGVDLEKSLQDSQKRLDKIAEEKNKLATELQADRENLEELNKKKNKLTEEINSLDKSLKNLEKNRPRSEKDLFAEKEKLTILYSELDWASTYHEEQEKRDRKLKELHDSLKSTKEALEQIQKNIKETEKELEGKKEIKKEVDRQNMSAILAGEMEEGSPCPVCGSTHHQEPAEISENNNPEVENRITEMERELLSLHKKESSLNSTLMSLENELKGINEENSNEDSKDIKIIGLFEQKKFDNTFDNDIEVDIDKYFCQIEKVLSPSSGATLFDKTTFEGQLRFFELPVNNINTGHLTILSKIYDGLESKLEDEEAFLDSWQEKREKLQSNHTDIQNKLNNLEIKITRLSEKVRQQSSLLQNINEEEVSLKEQIKEIKKDYQETKRVIDIDIDIENFIEYDRKINDKDQKREECIRDISNYRNHFEKLNKELTELENRKNKQELQAQEISIKVSNIKEMIENNQAKINHVVGDREAADYLKEIEDKQKNLLEKEKQTHKELNNIKEELSNKKSDLNALTVSMEKNKNEIENVQQFLESKTNEYGIREFDELEDYILPEKELDKIEEKIRKYTNSIAEIKGKIEMFEDTLKGREIKSEEIGKTKKEKYELEKRRNVLIGNLASLGDRIERIGSKLKEKKEYMKKLEKVEEELALIKEINDLVGANKFVEFVALRQLKYIAREASNRLLEITNDRYQLELDQNGEFVICDNYNGGVKRDCNTLSGGETFLTSLALALSLSSHIQLKGKAEMEFFFLDEGFGTLDTELLDIVMNSLESLKEERLSVGIISHVEELKNRVPVTLSVIPAEAGLHGTIVELKYK